MSGFTLEKLNQSIKGFQENNNSDRNNEFPKTVFLPEGNHKGRFIIDPTNEIFLDYYSYGFFARGIRDPRNDTGVPEGFVNELETLYKDKFQPRNKWSYGSKYNALTYFYLYETDKPSEDWKPNTLYVIIGNNKFSTAYMTFLAMLSKDAPDDVMKSLTPSEKGVILTIAFKGGNQGSCSISASYPTKHGDPINMEGVPYVPLTNAYIRPGFNQEKYDALVKRYKDEAAKLGAIEEANGAGAHDSSQAAPADIPNSVGQSMINQASTTTASTEQQSTATQAQTQSTATAPVEQEKPSDPPFEPTNTTTQQSAPAADAQVDPWAKFKPQ